ncbi:MAG: GNAT family N-acetyltransferase [Acidobacteria bacterium]|nr:GNAT family N-acetyltransferase [Acidobacteriota bacterium]
MVSEIQIRALSPADRELLLAMYGSFEPLGVAQGLPPRSEEASQTWIDHALQEEMNVGAFSAAGEPAGHAFLAAAEPGVAELAVFVHQSFRGRGIGTALVRAVLAAAENKGLRRVWAQTSSDNVPALRMLKRCGFRSLKFTFPVVEMAIELPAPVLS